MTTETDSITEVARSAVDQAHRWFDELGGTSVSFSFHPQTAPRADVGKELVVELPDEATTDPELVQRCVHHACARHVWCHAMEAASYRKLLARVPAGSTYDDLVGTLAVVDELGLRTLLYERQLAEGSLEAFTHPTCIEELDRFANRVAMDFCDWDRSAADIDSVALERALTSYAECVRALLRRYVNVRLAVAQDFEDAESDAADVLGATIGLETLAEHDDFAFLESLWREGARTERCSASGARVVPVEIALNLNAADLEWPEDDDFEGASGNRSFQDLSGVTWDEVRSALPNEERLVNAFAASADAGAVLVDLPTVGIPDVELDEFGGFDIGTLSATLALNAAGCPTITACAGHRTGYPYVAFWTRAPWVPLLAEAAGVARVGLGNAQYGAAEVFTNADDLTGLVRLARELDKRADAFAKLR